MSDTPTPQARGNFVGFYNRTKKQGDSLPHFTGKISKPGDTAERGVAIWANKDKKGRVYFSGRIDTLPVNTDVMSQLQTLAEGPTYDVTDVLEAGPNLTLKPNEFVLFANKFKDDANGQPDFWGRAHFGDGTEVVQIGVWARQDRYQRPLLSGATTYPLPGQSMEEAAPDMADIDPASRLDQMIADGTITRGMPDNAEDRPV